MTNQSSPSSAPRIVVLISGNGSNLQAILDACGNGSLSAKVVLVVSNKSAAYGLERASKSQVPTFVKTLKSYKDQGKSREQFDKDLAQDIKRLLATDSSATETDNNIDSRGHPDLIVLAGWMHILSPAFIDSFKPGTIINLHPALPGAFDGAHAIERAYEAFQKGLITETGVMVHEVIPEVDKGPVILSRPVPIHKEDTCEDLESRIHSVEHQLLIEGIRAKLGL